MFKLRKMQKGKVILCALILLPAVCGLLWGLLPTHFLNGVEPEDVAAIQIHNGNNGDIFEITSRDGISRVVNAIQQIAFKKDDVVSELPYWYQLTFIDGNGEEITSLGVQNSRFLQQAVTQKGAVVYRCEGELGVIGDYLESLEAAQFPDYNKDPDFPYTI